ncbi:MAG TPA: S8 family serine peptidase [Solirubrobacterales bacterium]|nr:S8 family serine peptidase [Solirubrobacterales bacterium]
MVVSVRFDHGALARRGEVEEAGGRVVSASRAHQSATVAIGPARLRALAEVPGVASVRPLRTPLLFAANCEGGSVSSEGVAQLHADAARTQFGVDGSGITVGVLSDSYARDTGAATDAAEDVESADLPGSANECSGQTTPVNVIEDLSEPGSDEGRAMLQIVHDMAPGANLSFATAFESEEGFAKNIEKLASAGADVIVDDVAWFEEPFFQDGPIAVAVNEVASEGVTYLSAAGNDNLFDAVENEIASWEAPAFRDSGGCPDAIEKLSGFNGTHCMDFDPGSGVDETFGITVQAGETLTIDLQWAEPWEEVDTDLDAVILSGAGKILTGSTEGNTGPTGTQRPLEILQWVNSGATKTVQLAINRFVGGNPRLKSILLQNGGGVSAVEYPRSSGGDVVGPSIFGHAGAAAAIAVGAVPFNDNGEPEPYSSRGPVAHYFEPVEGPVAAGPLSTPEVLSKPEIAATDCGATTFFAFLSGGVWRFCGTSAAAPHAAGAVALMREAAPTAGADLLRESLVGTAAPVGEFGPCAVGGGLVETVAAVEAAREEIAPGDAEVCAAAAVGPAPPNPGGGGGPAPIVLSPGESPPVAPDTLILRHPRKVVLIRAARARVVFRFGSSQSGVTFLCKVDRSAFRACGARTVRRLASGRHALKVKARNSSGLVDATPAVFRFRVVSAG